jgi:hypothetical protein
MNVFLAAALTATGTVLIVAGAAVLIVRTVMRDTTSADRARVLACTAQLIRAIRGKD